MDQTSASSSCKVGVNKELTFLNSSKLVEKFSYCEIQLIMSVSLGEGGIRLFEYSMDMYLFHFQPGLEARK